jgi:hypothetical protein
MAAGLATGSPSGALIHAVFLGGSQAAGATHVRVRMCRPVGAVRGGRDSCPRGGGTGAIDAAPALCLLVRDG